MRLTVVTRSCSGYGYSYGGDGIILNGKFKWGSTCSTCRVFVQNPAGSTRSLPVEFEFVLEPQNIPRSCGDLLVCQKWFQTDLVEFA